jgi:hypothetical protein
MVSIFLKIWFIGRHIIRNELIDCSQSLKFEARAAGWMFDTLIPPIKAAGKSRPSAANESLHQSESIDSCRRF